jgi:hypothetical protein
LKEKYFTLNAVKAIINVFAPDGYLLHDDQFFANRVFRRAGDKLDLELSSFLSCEQLDEINCSSKAMLSIRKERCRMTGKRSTHVGLFELSDKKRPSAYDEMRKGSYRGD